MARQRKLGSRQKANADAAFLAAFERAMVLLGATKRADWTWTAHEYEIETRAGRLGITGYPTSLSEPGGWVAMRFDDTERANTLGLGQLLNRNSGKYNVDSLYGCSDATEVTDTIMRHVQRAL